MRHLIATRPFMEEVNSMRKAINENLISLLEEHNVNYIDCFLIGGTPIVSDYSLGSDTFSLDTIIVHKYSNGTDVEFECTNSHTNKYVHIEDIGIERLINIYDWVKANEKELFEDVE